jgi:invasion protein IalB
VSTIRKIFVAVFAAVMVTLFALQVQAVNAQQGNPKNPVTSPCKPGNGYGDKNHCHSGAPGQNR